MKIAAVVILYNPAKDAISNIKTYYDYVDKIFVFDNSEVKSALQDELLRFSKIEFYQDFNNEGIAKRLNESCKLALKQQFDWILTMDQDTSFSADAILSYLDCFNQYKQKEKVAIFGTNYSRKKHQITYDCKVEKAEKLITSGSLLNLSLFKAIGEFDEKLFIDAVDYDYCFRAQMAGYATLRFFNIYILHTVGNEMYRSSIKTLFLVRKKKEIHSPLRCYYMYRNMLYLSQKYKNEDKIYSKQIKDYILSRIKISLLYGRNALKILKYLKAAKTDFLNNNFGRIKNEY